MTDGPDGSGNGEIVRGLREWADQEGLKVFDMFFRGPPFLRAPFLFSSINNNDDNTRPLPPPSSWSPVMYTFFPG